MKFNHALKYLLFLLLAITFLLSCVPIPIDSETNSSTPSASPTILPTLATTATSIPTLTSDQRNLQVKEWLVTNAGCKLPCWWGIEPEESMWNEVDSLLNEIGATSEVFSENGVTLHHARGFIFEQEQISSSIYFFEENNLITSIVIDSSGYNYSPEFKNIWKAFSPEMIIKEYGVPTRIWVKSRASVHEGDVGSTMPYWVWFFYDQQGILISYGGQVNYEGVYKICPTFSNQGNLSDDIDIFLQSPNAKNSLENIPTVKYNTNNAISLEEAAGITPEEFYELFTDFTREPCFETPRNIWP